MIDGFTYERKLADKLEKDGWHVERVASSGRRRNSVCDLVGVKNGKAYLIEVKTRNKRGFYIKKFGNDLEKLRKVAIKVDAVPILAVLIKRKGWKYFDLRENIPNVVK
jgi:Holliday junction resolvase